MIQEYCEPKMSNNEDTGLLSLLDRISYPVKPPVGVFQLVFFRSFTIIYMLFTFMASLLSLILQPWKIEEYEDRYLEFGLWKICKIEPDDEPLEFCFSKYYNDDNTPAWFHVFRYFTVTSTIIQFVVFFLLVTLTTFKSDRYKKPWPVFSYSFLLAGCLSFSALIVFRVDWEFNFASEPREIMDWTEETNYSQTLGYPYMISWCTVGLVWFGSYLCYYTKCVEENFMKQTDELAVEKRLLDDTSTNYKNGFYNR